MPTRTSSARWQGTLPDGQGTMSLGSGAYQGSFSFQTRFGETPGTNPEELIAAAHAGCFSMALSNILSGEGHPPTSVETRASVRLEKLADGFTITRIDLVTRGDVPGMSEAEFVKHAEAAKVGCPVSKALAAVEITLDAALV